MPITPTPIPKMNSKSLMAPLPVAPAINAYARALFPVLQLKLLRKSHQKARDGYEIVPNVAKSGSYFRKKMTRLMVSSGMIVAGHK
jgi:hypothetical protein